MKKILMALFILQCALCAAQSSVYKPFCKKPSWTYGGTNFGITWYDTYTYQKDTVIGGLTYEDITSAGYNYYFREDSAQKKVYRYDTAASVDYLYVDFNMVVGDTFTIKGAPATGTVVTRDSVSLNGDYHTQITFSVGSSQTYEYTEGIMSHKNPVNSYYWSGGGSDPLTGLVCMCHDNVSYYLNTFGGTFACPLSCSQTMAITHLKASPLKVSPNPVSDQMRIEFQGEEKATITLQNVLGKVVRHYSLNKSGEVDVREIPAGMYTLVVTSSQGQFTYKIVIDR